MWNMNCSLQNFMRLPIDLVSLALLLLEMFPKYGNTAVSSNFGTAVTTGLWRDMLLRNFDMQLSANFIEEAFL